MTTEGGDHERLLGGLQRLNALARLLLAEPSLDVLLARIAAAARELTGADFSALILLRPGTTDEVGHFAYDGQRELFPDRLPRAVGLLAVPITGRWPVRLDDIRDHPAGVGIPVEHPPIAALLAVPITSEAGVVGELAVANQPGGNLFDDVDEVLVSELAGHAGTGVSLAAARQAEARLEATRRALLDVALHNIRTPLTVATGFLSALRRHADRLGEEGRRDAFDAIERAHTRIHELAEGALLHRPDRPPAEETAPVEIVVAGLVEELVAGRPVVVTVLPDAPRSVVADRRMVHELLDALISNAVQHSPPGEPVRLSVRTEGSCVRFDVTDAGPGLSAEDQGRVFEQHERTRQSVEAGIQGAGLGLWLARRLADLLGGTVGVGSRLGEGATFWATVPLSPR
ncbi:MAG TPA: GAF domain-containing sensor histidine kinase [Acidimicrobiales bacterium]|nr:GAF domain-containing sensor histidine kinase [Acidimicrobiales bacterium]